jgi:hypothetical protein
VGELHHAVRATESKALGKWFIDAAEHTGDAGWRRVKNVGNLAERIGKHLWAEGKELGDAYDKEHFFESLWAQSRRAGRELGEAVSNFGKQTGRLASMACEPSKLPEAVVLVAAAVVTSGGIDGDGGVPDLDLSLGIDAHRSIFTHSIVSGTVIEGCLYATCTLIGLVHRNLPDNHDPLFDLINENRIKYLEAATAGASAGIAYHLAVDAALQPGAYHDLPFSMPMEGHQIVQGASAVAEGNDVKHKRLGSDETTRPNAVDDVSAPSGAFTEREDRACEPASAKRVIADRTSSTEYVRANGKGSGGSTPAALRAAIPDALKRGTTRQLWFAWLHVAGGDKRAVILVPNSEARARGYVEFFDGKNRSIVVHREEDVWPNLTLLSDGEQALRKELVTAYRAVRKALDS